MTDGRKATLKAEAPLRPEQTYLERKAEVTRRDHEEFSQYLQEKTERDRLQLQQLQQLQPVKTPETPPSKLNRRSILTWVAGTAVVGEAVTLGYPLLTAQNAANQDAGGATSTAPSTASPWRSAAWKYCERSLVPMLKKSTSAAS